jgi:hypothetical protein
MVMCPVAHKITPISTSTTMSAIVISFPRGASPRWFRLLRLDLPGSGNPWYASDCAVPARGNKHTTLRRRLRGPRRLILPQGTPHAQGTSVLGGTPARSGLASSASNFSFPMRRSVFVGCDAGRGAVSHGVAVAAFHKRGEARPYVVALEDRVWGGGPLRSSAGRSGDRGRDDRPP